MSAAGLPKVDGEVRKRTIGSWDVMLISGRPPGFSRTQSALAKFRYPAAGYLAAS